MAQSSVRNTYEEYPDRLKELVKTKAEARESQQPIRLRRGPLLKEHDSQLKLLAEGNVPVRSFVLPLPYPPSKISTINGSCNKVRQSKLILPNLRIDVAYRSRWIMCHLNREFPIHSLS
jgi:hypothetical protein